MMFYKLVKHGIFVLFGVTFRETRMGKNTDKEESPLIPGPSPQGEGSIPSPWGEGQGEGFSPPVNSTTRSTK